MTCLQICHFTSANRCYFKNVTALFTSVERWAKRLFVGFEKDGLLAELQARTSRSCRFCCFFKEIYYGYTLIPDKQGFIRKPKWTFPACGLSACVYHIQCKQFSVWPRCCEPVPIIFNIPSQISVD